MTSPTNLIKCRDLIGRLKKFGIAASRRTFSHADQDGPYALLVAEDGRVWLTVLWGGTTVQNQLAIEDGTPRSPSLEITAQCLIEWRRLKKFNDTAPLPALLIIAPALDRQELPAGCWHCGSDSVPVLTRQACGKAETLARSILSLIGPVLPGETIDAWRAIAVPEVRIENQRRRQPIIRDHSSIVAPLLLDYKQERCARLDLEPDAAITAVADDLNVRVVTGVAGCGKTLVLVHRAALLATHFPSARVLVVSHNRPLIRDLERRVHRFKAAGRIECKTFYSWLGSVAPVRSEMMKPHEVGRWMERTRQQLNSTSLEKFSDEWLIEELGWMFDHDHAGESYLTAVRKGRGIPLNPRQRQDMLSLCLNFRTHLRQTNSSDWSERPLHISDLNLPVLRQPLFDHILIDEAQFFAPVWLRLLTGVLKPGGHLFLCADPTQGFLRRRTSWNEIGLDVRSRSHRLEKPYRSTRAILEFARDFYQRRLPNEDEPLNLPAPEWMQSIEPGTTPILQPGGAPQDQITRLASELAELRNHGTPLGDVLVLVAGQKQLETNIVSQLNTRLGEGSAASLKDQDAPEHSAGVANLMAATGLERPIVFLLGLDDLAAAESDPTLTTEEGAEKQLEHTRLIYVGLTRAMDKVVIYSSNARLRAAFGLEDSPARIA